MGLLVTDQPVTHSLDPCLGSWTPTSPLQHCSHSGPYSGSPLASCLPDPHPGCSYVHLEPPHALSFPLRPPGTISRLQHHPLFQPRSSRHLWNASHLAYTLEPFSELYRHRSALHTIPSPPSGLYHALDCINSTDVSSAWIPLTLEIQLRVGVLSDSASTARLVLQQSGEAEPSPAFQHCQCFQDSCILHTTSTCLGYAAQGFL
jgi:hypothetical protein